jgi:hypothetical protein
MVNEDSSWQSVGCSTSSWVADVANPAPLKMSLNRSIDCFTECEEKEVKFTRVGNEA